MVNTERDKYICADYKDGTELGELSRSYGVSERRIVQILDTNEVQRRPRTAKIKEPLSREHVRLGLQLYSYRFKRDIDVFVAANDLGWSMIKLRKIEKGTTEVELLDLLDIAAFTKIPLSKLIN